jgi:phospholipase D1/2
MPRVLRAVLVTLALAGAIVGLAWLDLWEHLSVESMRTVIEAWGALGPLVFIAIFVAGFFVPGPEILMVAVGGVLFGPLRAFAYAWIAAVVGTGVTFLLVRYTAQDWVQRALRERFPRLRALDDRLERHGLATIVLLRLLLFLAPPLNWALGASRVGVRDYLLGTALGILPGIGLTVFLADRITETGSAAGLLDWQILVPAVALALLIALGMAAGRRLLGGSRRRDPRRRQADRRAAREHAAIERAQQRGR